MRLADVLLDLATVFNASRSVATRHAALRAQQWDRYKRTSNVAATVSSSLRGARAQRTGRAVPREKPSQQNDGRDNEGSKAQEKIEQVTQGTGVSGPEVRLQYNDVTGDGLAQAASIKLQVTTPGVADRTSQQQDGVPLTSSAAGSATVSGVPEGINLDVFRTSRGKRLNPYQKQETQAPSTQPRVQAFTPAPWATSTTSSATSAEADAGAQSARRNDEEGKLPDHVQTTKMETPAKIRQQLSTGEEQPLKKDDAAAIGQALGAATAEAPAYQLRESKVPSSRFGRIWNYSGLAAGMFGGAIGESVSRAFGGSGSGSLMLSPANMERLVAKLSKMRGAALKLGQMMSFQDSKMLPAPIQEVLQRVQDKADYMPAWQRDRVLATNLGTEWRDIFESFDEKPIAAASIGQVHRAVLKSDGTQVAVKIQFPGVADSINSDLDNLGILLSASKLLPKGLYLNKTIDNARTELAWECDYEREANCAIHYRELLASEADIFQVPRIFPEASGKQVLAMEYMEGTGVTRVTSFTQDQKDWIGTQVMRLCLREMAEFHFMQTDPNWTNFLYNSTSNKLVLLDFGASREYPEKFINLYLSVLRAASRNDRDSVVKFSEELGYLTGHESKAMVDAHVASVMTLAEPFAENAPEVYDFKDQTITERVKAQIPVMIRERLAPPPEETYSLHRKLSGAFLLCARLGSRVRCRDMFQNAMKMRAGEA